MRREYILCVDDEAIILESLKREMREEFGRELDVEAALSGAQALKLIEMLDKEGAQLAVLVTDQRMPGMDGSELLSRVKRNHPDAQAIMLTGYTDIDALKLAVNEAGLFRFISKPWSSADLKLSCRKAIELRGGSILNRSLIRQISSLNCLVTALLESVIDCHDPETFDHVRKVSYFSVALGAALGLDPLYLRRLLVFSTLHDIGKVGIPMAIINKPGPLDRAEMELMRTHVAIGANLVRDIQADPMLLEIIQGHHERWNGAGYPDGLKGEASPMAARIVAMGDVLDALLSPRPYKKAFDFESAAAVIEAGRGEQFDPRLVEAFVKAKDTLRELCTEPSTERCMDIIGVPSSPH
jgi:response regulator RpfG family c-di-GMP phosphodiesterase